LNRVDRPYLGVTIQIDPRKRATLHIVEEHEIIGKLDQASCSGFFSGGLASFIVAASIFVIIVAVWFRFVLRLANARPQLVVYACDNSTT